MNKRLPEDDLEHILTKTNNIWDLVRNNNIFITGGTGFFGKWLLESFVYINEKLNLNATATILTRSPEKFLTEFPFYSNISSVKFTKGDVLNFSFPEEGFQFIIHAATEADAALNASHPLSMLDTITSGTRRILDFAKTKTVKSLLFTSSGAVYGKQPENVLHTKENDSFYLDINNPESAYAEGKRIAELYCSVYSKHYNIPIKIARCFAFVGPYLPLDKHFAIGNFILNALNNEDIIIKGDGTPYRSYLYAADLTIWLWTILLKGENLTPYNVGSDDDHDLLSVAQMIAKLNPSVNVEVLSKKNESKPIERYVPDISFIKEKLDVEIYFKLKESIKKTQDFYTS